MGSALSAGPTGQRMESVAVELVPAPWGPIHLAATARAVVALDHLVPTEAFLAALSRRFAVVPQVPGGLALTAAEQVEAYLAGRRRSFDLPIDLGGRPAWDRAVLEAVTTTGWGEVTSYGRVARLVGRPGAARAVGGAVGRNPVGLLVPCHRVIAGDGTLGGYGGGWWGAREALLEIKRELLRLEGVALPARRPGARAGPPAASGRRR